MIERNYRVDIGGDESQMLSFRHPENPSPEQFKEHVHEAFKACDVNTLALLEVVGNAMQDLGYILVQGVTYDGVADEVYS